MEKVKPMNMFGETVKIEGKDDPVDRTLTASALEFSRIYLGDYRVWLKTIGNGYFISFLDSKGVYSDILLSYDNSGFSVTLFGLESHEATPVMKDPLGQMTVRVDKGIFGGYEYLTGDGIQVSLDEDNITLPYAGFKELEGEEGNFHSLSFKGVTVNYKIELNSNFSFSRGVLALETKGSSYPMVFVTEGVNNYNLLTEEQNNLFKGEEGNPNFIKAYKPYYTIGEITRLLGGSDFDRCFKEATELVYGPFCPELDNLVDQTIESIVYKIVMELDILTEGHLDINPENPRAQEWIEKARTFITKWRGWERSN